MIQWVVVHIVPVDLIRMGVAVVSVKLYNCVHVIFCLNVMLMLNVYFNVVSLLLWLVCRGISKGRPGPNQL